MEAHMSEVDPGPDALTTSDERGELFGVHIPELQLPAEEYRGGMRAAELAAGEHYLELGSGHGRGLVMAAVEFEADAHGIEYLEDAIERALRAAQKAGVADRVEITRDDLRRARVASADVVHMHLGPAFHDVLADRLERLLTPNARVIAAGWKVPGWQPLPDALAAWDGGYVYRPADPRWQATWGEPTEVEDGVRLVPLNVHADLEAIEPRVTAGSGSATPAVAVSRARAGRGQELTIAVAASSTPVELTVWARSRNGRFTQRGAVMRLG
jgi:predicted O-methyltransferase YrrM